MNDILAIAILIVFVGIMLPGISNAVDVTHAHDSYLTQLLGGVVVIGGASLVALFILSVFWALEVLLT